MESDQTTLNMAETTGADYCYLRAGRARVTSIQGRGDSRLLLYLLHDAATAGAAAAG